MLTDSPPTGAIDPLVVAVVAPFVLKVNPGMQAACARLSAVLAAARDVVAGDDWVTSASRASEVFKLRAALAAADGAL